MELKNMKHEETERLEVYYERIQKLVHGLTMKIENIKRILIQRWKMKIV